MWYTRITLINLIFFFTHFLELFKRSFAVPLYFSIRSINTDWDELIFKDQMECIECLSINLLHPYPSEPRIIQHQIWLRYWAIHSSWIKYQRWWHPVINCGFLISIFKHIYLSGINNIKGVLWMTHLHKKAYRLFIIHWHWISTQC